MPVNMNVIAVTYYQRSISHRYFPTSLNKLPPYQTGESVCKVTFTEMYVPNQYVYFFIPLYTYQIPLQHQIDALVQERCNSSALAMELGLSCTRPSKWSLHAHCRVYCYTWQASQRSLHENLIEINLQQTLCEKIDDIPISLTQYLHLISNRKYVIMWGMLFPAGNRREPENPFWEISKCDDTPSKLP